MTKRPEVYVDVDAWERKRVPREAVTCLLYVHAYRKRTGTGPSWADIAHLMDWDHLDRRQWRIRMKRLRRWGLQWRFNVPGSTKVHKDVVPFVEAIVREATRV